MTVRYITGDLFDAVGHAALGHGVNCRGFMGAGIAPQFRTRWPAMFAEYQRACASGQLTLGGFMPWRDPESGQVIYNLATQDRPGRYATLDAVQTSLTLMVQHAYWKQVPRVAIPRLGAGIGGLAWHDVRAVVEAVAEPSPVEVTVVTLPARG